MFDDLYYWWHMHTYGKAPGWMQVEKKPLPEITIDTTRHPGVFVVDSVEKLQQITGLPAVAYDFIEKQQEAASVSHDSKKLFDMWEDVCKRYERKEIDSYTMGEMRDTIFPMLENLAVVRKTVDRIGG